MEQRFQDNEEHLNSIITFLQREIPKQSPIHHVKCKLCPKRFSGAGKPAEMLLHVMKEHSECIPPQQNGVSSSLEAQPTSQSLDSEVSSSVDETTTVSSSVVEDSLSQQPMTISCASQTDEDLPAKPPRPAKALLSSSSTQTDLRSEYCPVPEMLKDYLILSDTEQHKKPYVCRICKATKSNLKTSIVHLHQRHHLSLRKDMATATARAEDASFNGTTVKAAAGKNKARQTARKSISSNCALLAAVRSHPDAKDVRTKSVSDSPSAQVVDRRGCSGDVVTGSALNREARANRSSHDATHVSEDQGSFGSDVTQDKATELVASGKNRKPSMDDNALSSEPISGYRSNDADGDLSANDAVPSSNGSHARSKITARKSVPSVGRDFRTNSLTGEQPNGSSATKPQKQTVRRNSSVPILQYSGHTKPLKQRMKEQVANCYKPPNEQQRYESMMHRDNTKSKVSEADVPPRHRNPESVQPTKPQTEGSANSLWQTMSYNSTKDSAASASTEPSIDLDADEQPVSHHPRSVSVDHDEVARASNTPDPVRETASTSPHEPKEPGTVSDEVSTDRSDSSPGSPVSDIHHAHLRAASISPELVSDESCSSCDEKHPRKRPRLSDVSQTASPLRKPRNTARKSIRSARQIESSLPGEKSPGSSAAPMNSAQLAVHSNSRSSPPHALDASRAEPAEKHSSTMLVRPSAAVGASNGTDGVRRKQTSRKSIRSKRPASPLITDKFI